MAVVVLGYAGVSRRLERTILTGPIVFVSIGLLVGGEGLGWFGLRIGSGAVRTLAEATLTLVLFTDASRINLGALRREVALPARLLGIGLPLTIAAGTGLALLVFGQLDWPEALLLAIVLAPTDAALGQAVVTDPRLPVRIRQALNVESGLNDGICVPLLFIALAVAEADDESMTAQHAVRLVVEEIGWGIVGGVAAGVLGALVLRFSQRRGLIADDWVQVIPLAAAALSYGIAAPARGQRLHRRVRQGGGSCSRVLERPLVERRGHLPRRRNRPGAERRHPRGCSARVALGQALDASSTGGWCSTRSSASPSCAWFPSRSHCSACTRGRRRLPSSAGSDREAWPRSSSR